MAHEGTSSTEMKNNLPHIEIWGVNSQNEIYRSKTGSGKDWKKVIGELESVSVGTDGSVWGVNAKNEIWHYHQHPNAPWDKIAGSLKQISVGRENHIWGVNAKDEIYSWRTNRGWKKIDGGLSMVSCGGFNDTVWGISSSNNIWRRDGEDGKWEKIAGKFKDLSVGQDGSVWCIDANNEIFQYVGNQKWRKVKGSGKIISVAKRDVVCLVNAHDEIYRYVPNNDSWMRIPGKLKYLSITV